MSEHIDLPPEFGNDEISQRMKRNADAQSRIDELEKATAALRKENERLKVGHTEEMNLIVEAHTKTQEECRQLKAGLADLLDLIEPLPPEKYKFGCEWQDTIEQARRLITPQPKAGEMR